jgi:hypothetical protein
LKSTYHSLRYEVNRQITRHIILSEIEEGDGVWRIARGQVRQMIQTYPVAN